jgi:serine/threonine protein kinase
MEAHYKKLDGMYSPELIDVVRMCLKLDPMERPQSVFALQKALATKAVPQRELTFLEKAKLKMSGMLGKKNKTTEDGDFTTIQEDTI